MLVQSFLVQGAATSAVASQLGSLTPSSLDGLVLMSLGMDHKGLLDALMKEQFDLSCPVYLTETYGILGFDDESGANIELMEKGRGSEYGFCGGSGGTGCLAIGYSGGAVLGSAKEFPPNASSLMVIADQSGSWAKDRADAPLHYGGITKKAWKVDTSSGELKEVPYFWVADTSGEPIGVSTFQDEAGSATSSLLEKLPSGHKASGSIGLFPCFTRGVNHYGKEHIEPTEVAASVKDSVTPPRIYGMFAHGELGPSSYAGFTSESNTIPCTQHSMTSILSIHTATSK